MKKYKLYFVALLMIAITACSTINVKHVDAKSEIPKNDGIYYSLPKTAVTVEVTVDKIYKVKGPYFDYANKYLGLSNVISENSTTYNLDNIKLSSYTIPDPNQLYFVEVPNGCKKKNDVFLQLSESGIISGVNDFNEMKPVSGTVSSSVETQEDLSDPSAQMFINSNLAESFDTIIEKVNLDTITIEKKVLKKIMIEKTIEQKAKEAADYIMRVKESKFNLLSGYSEVNYSKESIEYMNDQMDKQEQEYLNLFTGITVKHKLKYYFTYVPSDIENEISTQLFRFSPKQGVVDTSSFYGDNVIMQIIPFGSTSQLESFNKVKQDPKKKTHGFYYRIPEYAKVSIILNNKVKEESNILIDQFGVVSELPANKKMKATYYPNSGSLKTIAFKKRKHYSFSHH